MACHLLYSSSKLADDTSDSSLQFIETLNCAMYFFLSSLCGSFLETKKHKIWLVFSARQQENYSKSLNINLKFYKLFFSTTPNFIDWKQYKWKKFSDHSMTGSMGGVLFICKFAVNLKWKNGFNARISCICWCRLLNSPKYS